MAASFTFDIFHISLSHESSGSILLKSVKLSAPSYLERSPIQVSPVLQLLPASPLVDKGAQNWKSGYILADTSSLPGNTIIVRASQFSKRNFGLFNRSVYLHNISHVIWGNLPWWKLSSCVRCFKDLLRHPLAREGVYGPVRPAFLAHAMQRVGYIVGLTAYG